MNNILESILFFINGFKEPKDLKDHRLFVGICLAALVGLYYYFNHPPLNIQYIHSLIFIVITLVLVLLYLAYLNYFSASKKIEQAEKGILGVILVIIVGGLLIFGFTSKIFHAKAYANRIHVENVKFSSKTIKEVDFSKTPILDRRSTIKLGDKVMGDMPELVSQFEVSDAYTQISYKNSVYRVTPLEYAGVIKYFTNRSEGIPAYVLVNSTNGKTRLVKLKDLGLKGMKYVPSAYLNENLERKLQLEYPTTVFGKPSFEIDEQGHPYYVCTTYGYYGINNKRRVNGMILFDPITGHSKKYQVGHFPKWVDRVYPENLVMEEIDDNGSLKSGFINSIIGQKNVTVTSDGYNYLEKNGDIWIYSGITSANNDKSNLGFVLTDLRTHQTEKFYCSGANEEAAMESAEGEVKNYGYDATFPLLVNVSGEPVYLLSLKDNAGLVKMYAMVDAKDYQNVSVIAANSYGNLTTLKKQYIASYISLNKKNTATLLSKDILIKELNILTVENKTKYFIVDEENKKYKAEVTTSNEDILAFMHTGEKYHITYVPNEDVSSIKTIKKS